jgi:hypothetical protein
VKINFSGITDSTVNLYLKVRRIKFSVNLLWLKALNRMNYGEEMRLKFITGLHQNNDFQRRYLKDILDYPHWISKQLGNLENVRETLKQFIDSVESFNEIVAAEELNIVHPDHPIIVQANNLLAEQAGIFDQLNYIERQLSRNGYDALEQTERLALLNYTITEPFSDRVSFTDVFDKAPVSDHFLLVDFIASFNRVHSALSRLNVWMRNFLSHRNHKIIAGIAGTGKTHTIGYIVEQVEKQGDFVIFLNAKAFNGDNVNFENCFHQKLFIPQGYSLRESLEKLNRFARKKRKRLFIIFDALNETTTTTLGFSPIWEENLQSFINLINQYPHLYFVCTLRTSYIDEIWKIRPENIAIVTGVDHYTETKEMCIKYFKHYKIEVQNLDTADLSSFKVPLLLDLFCKMTNGDRIATKQIFLDGYSFKLIFEGYIDQLVRDVKKKRNLMLTNPLTDGLHVCSGKFMEDIEGTLSVAEFVQSFDPDLRVKANDSLAQPMLEGNLVFIKERIGPLREIVKHTQQLIGGYLLATYLNRLYPDVAQLLASIAFTEKINGNDPARHHQLRLDIIKFLIIYRPEIINSIKERKAFQESWWYLYNGFSGEDQVIPEDLLANPLSLDIFPYVMQVSTQHWLDPENQYNFQFIYQYLARFSTWLSDANWTFYVYNNADLFFDLIENRIEKLKKRELDAPVDKITSLLIALVNATNVMELRDQATAYLVEFGKLYPLELLEIAKISSSLADSYIYQRVIQALYGVALIKQHERQFIIDQLPMIANTLFKLQFAVDATHPVYDYIVIDSIKHLLDLALYNECWKAPEDDLANIKSFKIPNLTEWMLPSDNIKKLVQDSTEMSPPEPVGMDFAIYTIPRLIESGNYALRPVALENVLNRVYELGFQVEDNVQIDDDRFRSFYYGNRMNREGKVEKLGKKYNWKAFYDYAGYLLQNGELDTYRTFGDPSSGFKRLGDVSIDISMPDPNFSISQQFYFDKLIPAVDLPGGWQMEVKIETIEPHLVRSFDGVEYVMLKGVVEQRVNQSYAVRSFIMVESCLIEKNKGFETLKKEICPQIFNWDRDLHISTSYDSGVYFGEYYWADNQVEESNEHYSIKTGKKITEKQKVRIHDLFGDESVFTREDLGKERDFTFDELLGFDGEASLIQYLNESNSKSFNGFSMYIPTVKMGKYLQLKAEPATGRILDAALQPCLITVNYDQGFVKNEATYFRADLLKRYLNAHGLAIVFQNKQHSYDTNYNNRFMKYVVIEL